MDALIRMIAIGEAKLLVPLNAIVQRVHAERKPTHFRTDPDPEEVLRFFQTWLARPTVCALIAETDGKAIGYVLLEVHDIAASAVTLARKRGFVHHIAVVAEARRQGVGSALLEAAKTHFRQLGLTQWATSYWLFNEASAILMRKHGLEPAHLVAEGSLF